ncbi:aspartate aminotransferase family protein [Marinobacterium sp. D7]|uniref:aspartate aminotransferase family protein n=1 Tax=Marinobacterium ramblicola TaxID=2849041 RepID=UPI001C2D58A2|nr:aspartate aminotransferase family protein [Marinobacterium ramblicola]
MSQVFHRHCHTPLRTAVLGDGVYLYDQHGKAYLDASGGAAVSCLGHSHAGVRAALHKQIDQLAYAHSSFFTTEVAETLATRLTARAPGDLNHVYFLSGGSEAVEAALKLARQYFVERGENQRGRFVARRQSYHGNTLGALAVGGNAWRRAPFAPLLTHAEHIAPCYAYRDCKPGESLFDYGQRVANELEQCLLTVGPETVIAFVAEPVVGATAGALTAVEGYFKRIREICDRYGVLLILDEVMCGMGRTGTLFAHEQEGIEADIVTIAKGLGAGYQPIGAMLASDRIYDTIANGSGFFQHGHTYMAHATAMAGSLAVLDALEQEQILARVNPMGEALMTRLLDRFGEHPHIGDIRGRGLFQALELVHDRDSKRPFDPRSKLDSRIKNAAMERGLMCYPMAGTIDGHRGHHILLAPPFIIEESQLDELVDKLYDTVQQVCAEAVSEYPDAV